ncbi:unnamed protein product [Aspergillus oryzae]|uniref:Unnamed protein product n=2 Tax=Aspergillus oryzae TaxID=5062 RepID=A0AAN4YIW2_ASPOZ|nr:unnamed protein product [Aspergillus oryzae]GMF84564.1 unnamed protein product [Aspergillus oryzae]GMG12915.1 unnamed protein product [Aspergillus oryzae]GMG31554.1 unnamed protein product [Aspergillus oryzae]GMG47400.1 unnamed protein product [Aspergillus oryzae var. brunneus]
MHSTSPVSFRNHPYPPDWGLDRPCLHKAVKEFLKGAIPLLDTPGFKEYSKQPISKLEAKNESPVPLFMSHGCDVAKSSPTKA